MFLSRKFYERAFFGEFWCEKNKGKHMGIVRAIKKFETNRVQKKTTEGQKNSKILKKRIYVVEYSVLTWYCKLVEKCNACYSVKQLIFISEFSDDTTLAWHC